MPINALFSYWLYVQVICQFYVWYYGDSMNSVNFKEGLLPTVLTI